MIREKINEELQKKNLSVADLHRESGIRYCSLVEYLKSEKELSSKNIEIILKTLKLVIVTKSEADKINQISKLINSFDTNLDDLKTKLNDLLKP